MKNIIVAKVAAKEEATRIQAESEQVRMHAEEQVGEEISRRAFAE